MFWLSRPPYLRWGLAVAVAALGIWAEVTPDPGTLHPFAAESLPAGTLVTAELVEMRMVPDGLLDPVALPARVRVPVEADRPLLAPALDEERTIPVGWWTISLQVPSAGAAGSAVRLVVDDGTSVEVFDGMLVSTTPGEYGGTEGLVAVPGDAVAAVGATRSEVTVFLSG